MGQNPAECSISHIDGCLATSMYHQEVVEENPSFSKAKVHQNQEYFDSIRRMMHEAPGG